MDNTLKALLAKAWKDEALDLEPGRHDLDEMIMVRITGSVTKAADQMVAPPSPSADYHAVPFLGEGRYLP